MAEPLRVLLHNAETAALAERLHDSHPGIACFECQSYAALPAMLARHRPDVVFAVRFAGSKGYPRDALLGPEGPAWIANGGVGVDHLGQWDPARVTVTNAAGVASEMMAEYVLGAFLHFTLDVPGLQQDQRHKVWAARQMRRLQGETLLIAGLGHTGRAIAARAKAFGMHVIGTRARPQAMAHVDEVHPADDLVRLMPRAGFLAVSTPLTPRTRGLIGRAAFEAAMPGLVLADVSRGGVIDPPALLAALDAGRVAGAALDVFETEPLPADSPFWVHPRVLVSPHCSAVWEGWEEASFDLFLANLARWRAGAPLWNVVDPTRGY
ncbi:MAG: D-2-hydroxyacid dehydrogenase [Pseudomonadota bacterium]